MTPYWEKTTLNVGKGAWIGALLGLLAAAVYVLFFGTGHAPLLLLLVLIVVFARYTVFAGSIVGGTLGFLVPVKDGPSFFPRQLPLKLAIVVCLAVFGYAAIVRPGLTRHDHTEELRKALLFGTTQDVRNAIENGAEVDQPIGDGTPLYLAADKGDLETCRYLLSRGAGINHRNLSQETALWIALAMGHDDVATLLANSGADVNLTDDKGESPLMLAVHGNNTEMIRILISKGADVNHAIDHGSYSPLITTIMYDRIQNAKLLLDDGANPNLTPHNETPLTHARTKGDQQMVDLLLAHGAR